MAARSQYANRFEQVVAAERLRILESLANGGEHDHLLLLIGQAQGLVLSLRLSEQVDFELSGER
jgi:hypothetical protein